MSSSDIFFANSLYPDQVQQIYFGHDLDTDGIYQRICWFFGQLTSDL